ncbi:MULTISPECIES: hypothetical protein [unclassified Amycolatopsis]|uniref:hypothetical protein n=1 Tax=unclassified Amycolatopsis TaxID=2618356 RepID=UPI00287451D3|nr:MULTISPECIES: hypothetical protein [unclassified Amycolatopsis]MDS0133229.1 hypothetical protein [Amycolatopsis sp. 505]MDS0146459.1 hypothetical protein [Amycolatopsis sp. CM201R]
MTQTYNPIIQRTELPRFRITAPLRAPDLGTALVLERATGDPLVVRHGERVPDARTGNYRRVCLVDVATRGLSFTVNAASADAAFPFTVTVRFACRVTDPVTIARDDVRDMTAALAPSLSAIVREVAAEFDALQPTAAETAITRRLHSAHPMTTIELSGYTVSVSVVDTEEFVTTQRKLRVQKMTYDAMRPIAGGSREDMLAHLMSLDGGSPMSLLDRERKDREADTKAKLDALRILMGEEREGFDAAEVRKQVLEEFFPGETPSLPRRGTIRERLSTASRGALPESPVVEGNVPADDAAAVPPETGEPASGERRTSRVRGTMGPPAPSGNE